MKRLISLFLSITLIFGMVAGFDLSVVAEESNQKDDFHSVSYTDMFYGYSWYLTNYNNEMRKPITDSIISAGEEFGVDDKFLASLETTLDTVGDFSEMFYALTDAAGLTSHMSNEAADSAITTILKNVYEDGDSEFWNIIVKTETQSMKALKNSWEFVDNFNQTDLENYTLNEVYEQVLTKSIEKTCEFDVAVGKLNITNRTKIIKTIYDYYSDYITSWDQIAKLTKCINTILFYQNVEIELINYILSFEGLDEDMIRSLQRVKSYITTNYATYFIEKITKEVVDEMLDIMGDCFGYSNPWFKLAGIACELTGWLFFDVIFEHADAKEYLTYVYLVKFLYSIQYEMNSRLLFLNTDLVYSKTISDFEYFYKIYASIYKAANMYAEKLSGADTDFKYQEYFFDCSKFVEYARMRVETIGVESRVEKAYISDKVYKFSEPIIISNEIKDTACLVTFHNKIMAPLVIDSNVEIDECDIIVPQLTINRSLIINTSFLVKGNCTIGENAIDEIKVVDGGTLHVMGDVNCGMGSTNAPKLIVEKNGKLNVDGNFTFIGTKTVESEFHYNSIYVYGILNVCGNLEVNNVEVIYVSGNMEVGGNANIVAKGNRNSDSNADNEIRVETGGELHISGDAIFNTANLGYKIDNKAQLIIEQGGMIIADSNFMFNGSKLIGGGFNYNYLYVYGQLLIKGNLRANSVTHSYIYGDVMVNGNVNYIADKHHTDVTHGHIYIYANGCFSTDGDFTLKGSRHYNTGNNWFHLDLFGTLLIKGNFSASEQFIALYQTTKESVWEVKGDFYLNVLNKTWIPGFSVSSNDGYTCSFTAGLLKLGGDFINEGALVTPSGNYRIQLIGTEKQNISHLTAPTIIIDNESEQGVYFNSAINPNRLFNHKGNKFTLYNNGTGSTFVDYDGDGLLDNEDMEPTAGNPCVAYLQSADETQGTVVDTKIATVGGTEITVSASPSFKYQFVKWTNEKGETVSYSKNYTFIIKEDVFLTANFEKRSQYISVDVSEGGYISVPWRATIESKVLVTVIEEDGYVFEEGSLKQNGIDIVDGQFIMPDERVLITAKFERNPYYFLLKDKIYESESYTFEMYSKESFSELTVQIAQAKEKLVNNISQEEAEEQINNLDKAIESLTTRYVVDLKVNSIPEIYVGLEELQEKITLTVTYDNGVIFETTEYIVTDYQSDVVGTQEVTFMYEEATLQVPIQVVSRLLEECYCATVSKQVFAGKGTESKPSLQIIYAVTGEELVVDRDYVVAYSNNKNIGMATALITGMGMYEGTLEQTFEIYCAHTYEEYEYLAPTCTEAGYRKEICTICEEIITSENYRATGHSYEEGLYGFEQVSISDFVDDEGNAMHAGNYNYDTMGDMYKTFFLKEDKEFDKCAFSTKIKFLHGNLASRIDIAGASAWRGFSVWVSPDGNYLYVSDLYGITESNQQYEISKDTAGLSSFLDTEFLLRMSFEYVDLDKDGNVNDLCLGVYINGCLYNNATFVFKQCDMTKVGNNLHIYCEEPSYTIVLNEVSETDDRLVVTTPPTEGGNGVLGYRCEYCGTVVEKEELPYLRFSGASLTLQNNLAIKYRVKKSVIDGFYENPYAIFEMGGKKAKVTRYIEDGEYYLFEFKNIAPHQMNDTIYATLYGEFNGKEYASAAVEYSVATYCYNMLPKLTSDSYAELRTLLVDLLNYGAEAQIYTDYNTDNLVNTSLTEEQATWATQGDPELETVLNTKYSTVESPSVKWKNAILNLNDSITIQVMMATDDISNLKVKFTDKDGKVLATVSESQFVETDGGYYVNFKGLHAGQMSEAIYITAYRDDVAVSNTVQYSIESYAYSKKDSDYLNLGDLVKAMMKYGDAAYVYSN